MRRHLVTVFSPPVSAVREVIRNGRFGSQAAIATGFAPLPLVGANRK
jgi:hypothetical protein